MQLGVVEFLGWLIIFFLIFMTAAAIFFSIFYYIPGTKCMDKQRLELAQLTEKIGSMVEYTAETNLTIYTCVETPIRETRLNAHAQLCFRSKKFLFLPQEEVCLKGVTFDLSRIGGKLEYGIYKVVIDRRELPRKVIFLEKIG